MHECSLYKKNDDGSVGCTACSHYCRIAEGGTGICGVRKNTEGKLDLLVYGLTSGVGLDPIEKKPLFHFFPDSEVYSIGTIGCNFRCAFCQNAWMSQLDSGRELMLSKLKKLSPEKVVKDCLESNVPIIAYTYNEPTVFFEYTYDVAKLAKENGIKNVYVSNGYASKEAIETISPYLDAINIDIKSFSDDFYIKICGGRLQPVLDNVKRYYEAGIWVEITTLIIPDENDSEEELTQTAEFIASVSKSIPWHISRFSPAYKMMEKRKTPIETLEQAYEIGKKAGLKYIYVGNIHDGKLHSTFCPKCKSLIIERDWGYCDVVNLKKGRCGECGEKIEGVWK